jgi:hypothetical protein
VLVLRTASYCTENEWTPLPYVGSKDRIVVSFNAQIRAPQGDQIYRYAGA